MDETVSKVKYNRMKEQKYTWKKEYSLVLIANIVYMIMFYFISNYFTV